MERLGEFFRRLVLGSHGACDGYFNGPQNGLVKTYESALRAQVANLFGAQKHKVLLEKFELMLKGVESLEGRQRLEAMFGIDAQLIAEMPDDLLFARRWTIVDRFRRIASARAYQAYEASLPAATDSDRREDADKLRPDLGNLANYVQQSYLLNLERERALASLKWWLLSRATMVVAFTALLLAAYSIRAPHPLMEAPASAIALFLVLVTGMIGAITSVTRKFQELARNNVLEGDPFNDIVALNAGRPSVAVSVVSGGIFAWFLYAMVAAGPLSQTGWAVGLLPSIDSSAAPETRCAQKPTSGTQAIVVDQKATPANDKTCKDGSVMVVIKPQIAEANLPDMFDTLAMNGLGFANGSDLLRMLLLAFLAGFAERLVPDTIDRLIKREKSVRGDV